MSRWLWGHHSGAADGLCFGAQRAHTYSHLVGHGLLLPEEGGILGCGDISQAPIQVGR